MQKIVAKTEKETWQQGFNLAGKLKGGEVLALYGDLGAGKTKFLQGLANGLGVKTKVNSPTFNILKLYKVINNKNIKAFCHIDAYRLRSEKDLINLGVEEFFQSDEVITAIEWAEKIEKMLPKGAVVIHIGNIDENTREIRIK